MRVITLEEHFASSEIAGANNAFSLPPQSQPQELADFYESHTAFGAELFDIEDMRLPYMDSQNITVQVLSYTSPVSDKVPAQDAVRICRRANDILAGHVAEHPDRFAGFATLPMSDPKAAADELERCVKELKFCGTLVAGQYQGHFYDEPQFLPVFAKAEELDVPVYFHPALINPAIQDYYFMSPSWSVVIGGQFASAGFGWHMDVGIHVVRMILSGIFRGIGARWFLRSLREWITCSGRKAPGFAGLYPITTRRISTSLPAEFCRPCSLSTSSNSWGLNTYSTRSITPTCSPAMSTAS